MVNGKHICSDPEDPWAIQIIEKLSERTTIKAPNTPPSTSTSWTTTTISTSTPGISTTSTITTTPKGTSTTWKKTTYITHTSSPKQPIGQQLPRWTTMQITRGKMATTVARKPVITDSKSTSTTMTTASPMTTTTPKGTSTTWKASTYITHTASPKQPFGQQPPQGTTTQIMTAKMTTTAARKLVITDSKTTSMTMTTASPVTLTALKGTSTTWKASTYIADTTSTKELPGNTKKPPIRTQFTTQIAITTKSKPVTPETKTTSMTMTTENRLTRTTPKGTSTTERPAHKPSTATGKPVKRCPTTMASSTTKKMKIPWTVRRLRKKSKKGLRRAQINPGCV
ncbi:mucin-5AC [Ictalurus punctatus]|uniref:Mucin-5AC n=1 Tax=Ictalurus punctatus TaxID=7998 RepID=A0A979EXU5_ICTPU|nr:mucin-5AC [Ictalurus punctatus]